MSKSVRFCKTLLLLTSVFTLTACQSTQQTFLKVEPNTLTHPLSAETELIVQGKPYKVIHTYFSALKRPCVLVHSEKINNIAHEQRLCFDPQRQEWVLLAPLNIKGFD